MVLEATLAPRLFISNNIADMRICEVGAALVILYLVSEKMCDNKFWDNMLIS
jgi:hypothetical protein